MKTIYKYPLKVTDFQEIELPEGAEILSVQTQILGSGKRLFVSDRQELCLWAMVDPDNPLVPRRIRIFGTGNPMEYEHELKFIGTCQMHNGALIWHVFENHIRSNNENSTQETR